MTVQVRTQVIQGEAESPHVVTQMQRLMKASPSAATVAILFPKLLWQKEQQRVCTYISPTQKIIYICIYIISSGSPLSATSSCPSPATLGQEHVGQHMYCLGDTSLLTNAISFIL